MDNEQTTTIPVAPPELMPPIITPEPKKETGFVLNPEGINKAGRPKKNLSMVELLKQELGKVDPNLKIKYKRIIAKQLVIQASNGNTKALREVFDRVDGRPKQSVDLTTNGQTVIKEELGKLRELINECRPNTTTT